MTSGENPGLVRQLADVKTLLAVFGLALYAILRIAYGRFYAALGLSPDDLGLGYVELLAQSAIGAVVLLAVFGLLMWSFAAFYVNAGQALLEDVRPARDWLRGRLGERALKESAGPVLAGVALALAGLLYWQLGSVDAALRPLAGVCVMYLGQSGGTIFLARGGATFRVPASIASVRIVPGARCETGMREPVR